MGNRAKKGTTFILLRPDGKILMQLRDSKSLFFPNLWCFPGGGCKGNEKPLDAVIREAKEEYGLVLNRADCKQLTTFMPGYDKELIDHVFVCLVKSEQKPMLNEGAAMKWMSLGEISGLNLGFEQENLLDNLDSHLAGKS